MNSLSEPTQVNFTAFELRCRCPDCRQQKPNHCSPDSLARLQRVRNRFFKEFGVGLALSSAYRCENHPEEVKKREKYGQDYKGGQHYQGTAFDVSITWGSHRQRLVQIAMEEGFTGFGYANMFLHLDDGHKTLTSWGYA